MHHAPIIPHRHSPNSPFPAHVMVVCGMDVISEKFEKLVCGGKSATLLLDIMQKGSRVHTGFLFLQFRETGYEAGVYIQRLQASDWVSSDGWMMRIDWRAAGAGSPEVEDGVVL